MSDWERTEIAGLSGTLSDVTWGDGQFVAVGYGPYLTKHLILTSPDGLSWADRSFDTSYGYIYGVAYGNGKYVAVGERITTPQHPLIVTSTDGISWTETILSSIDGYAQRVIYADGQFVAVGRVILTSPDGSTWTQRTNPMSFGSSLSDVTYGNGKFIAVGSNYVYSSTDGAAWTQEAVLSITIAGVAFGNGTFVAAGQVSARATTYYSDDAVTWTEGFYDTARLGSFRDVAFAEEFVTGDGYLDTTTMLLRPYIGTGTDSSWTTEQFAELEGSIIGMGSDGDQVVAVGFVGPYLSETPLILSRLAGGEGWGTVL